MYSIPILISQSLFLFYNKQFLFKRMSAVQSSHQHMYTILMHTRIPKFSFSSPSPFPESCVPGAVHCVQSMFHSVLPSHSYLSSADERDHLVFSFLFLTYFTQHELLQFYPRSCTGDNFIIINGWLVLYLVYISTDYYFFLSLI